MAVKRGHKLRVSIRACYHWLLALAMIRVLPAKIIGVGTTGAGFLHYKGRDDRRGIGGLKVPKIQRGISLPPCLTAALFLACGTIATIENTFSAVRAGATRPGVGVLHQQGGDKRCGIGRIDALAQEFAPVGVVILFLVNRVKTLQAMSGSIIQCTARYSRQIVSQRRWQSGLQ